LCFRKATQEIFPELDETSSRSLILPGSFQRTEEEAEWGHEGPTHKSASHYCYYKRQLEGKRKRKEH
jgi:hypothetical protein